MRFLTHRFTRHRNTTCDDGGVAREEMSYELSDEDARDRLRALSEYWSKKHGVHTEWLSDTSARLRGRKLGVKYDAKVDLGGGRVVVEASFGFLAQKLGGPEYVRRKVTKYLDPSVSLDELRAKIPD